MAPYALLVTIVLFGQLRAADDRYPPGTGGPAPTGGTADAQIRLKRRADPA